MWQRVQHSTCSISYDKWGHDSLQSVTCIKPSHSARQYGTHTYADTLGFQDLPRTFTTLDIHPLRSNLLGRHCSTFHVQHVVISLYLPPGASAFLISREANSCSLCQRERGVSFLLRELDLYLSRSTRRIPARHCSLLGVSFSLTVLTVSSRCLMLAQGFFGTLVMFWW